MEGMKAARTNTVRTLGATLGISVWMLGASLVHAESEVAPAPDLAIAPERATPSERDPITEHLATGFPLEGAHMLIRCESCHVRGIFAGTPRMCTGCHEKAAGFIDADVKPLDHIPTREECEVCHDQRTWHGAIYEHESETDGRCMSCHNNVTERGKPADHIPTTAQCDVCHGTLTFNQAAFDHSAAVGACINCHQGVTAPSKPPEHFVTTLRCGSCHDTERWKPIDFEHSSSLYPGSHRSSVDCADCHQGNSQAIAWPSSSFRGDCAACHATDFERDDHKKSESPTVYYTANELRDCTGTCHVYADSTFSEIRQSRSREHRVSAGEF
jgi:hypothetical protein